MSGIQISVLVLMGLVVLSLVAGVVLMAVGGKNNEKYSNKLMMMRVLTQGLVVALLGIMFVISL